VVRRTATIVKPLMALPQGATSTDRADLLSLCVFHQGHLLSR
jgi:hypothetical protein